MGDIVTHLRFDRPKVPQPNPRLRRGTICLSRVRRMRRAAELQAADRDDLERVRARCLQRTLDARKADMLPVYLSSGLDSVRIYHTLRVLGIELDFNCARNAFVLRAADERGPAA